MSSIKLLLISTATCLFLFPAIVFSQTKPAEPQKQPGETQDVIKFDTSLVQTDVTVFDKNGRFVDGLKPEQLPENHELESARQGDDETHWN